MIMVPNKPYLTSRAYNQGISGLTGGFCFRLESFDFH